MATKRDGPPATPHLDALAERGVLFENAWAFPACSPGRAALRTGRNPRRTGIGRWIDLEADTYGLPAAEVTYAELVGDGWDTSFVGKWHLSPLSDPAALVAPRDQGFDWHAGSMDSLLSHPA